MLQNGMRMSIIQPNQENPYKDSTDMHNDIEKNKHLWIYPTDQGFGSEGNAHKDHPLLQETGRIHNGHKMLANDEFRAVHDYFGHFAGSKTKFGGTGEHQAYIKHKKMFSPEAQKALATETMGQNNTVLWGKNGEYNRSNPSKTIFADQKAGLLPDNIINGKWHGEE